VTELTRPNDGAGRLVGWKAIAGHLEISQRTAVRWAEHYGLPVSRVSRGNRPLIFAMVQELEAWWGSAAAKEARGEVAFGGNTGVGVRPDVRGLRRFRKLLLVTGVLGCLIAAVAACVVYWPRFPSRQAEQTLPWKSANGAHGKATSGRLVKLRVAPVGGPWFSVTVAEGEMARLETATRRVGFQSRLADGQLKVFIYRLENRGAGESAAYVASRTLSNGTRVEPLDVGGELLDVMWPGDLPATIAEGRSPREPCCMVCTGVTACGQVVSTTCGRCQGNERAQPSKDD
jgi:hypothetical protein